MADDAVAPPVKTFGSWEDAERLRKWSFLQRTPQQRLDWLIEALSVAYQSGALEYAAGGRERADKEKTIE